MGSNSDVNKNKKVQQNPCHSMGRFPSNTMRNTCRPFFALEAALSAAAEPPTSRLRTCLCMLHAVQAEALRFGKRSTRPEGAADLAPALAALSTHPRCARFGPHHRRRYS